MGNRAFFSAIAHRLRFSEILIPFSIIIGSGILRLFQLGTQSLWFDEAYTVFVSQQPLRTMIHFLLTDGVHPPLYYFFMAIWIKAFGSTEWVIRMPSALAGISTVVILYYFSRKYFGAPCGAISALLLGLSPFALWYSQDARMYSLLGLFALIAMGCFWAFIKRPSIANGILLLISHAVVYGIHYFGASLLLVEIIFFILYWRKYISLLLSFLLIQCLAILPLMYWWFLLLSRIGGSFGIGWIHKPDGIDFPSTIINLFIANGGSWSMEAVLAAGILLGYFYFATQSKLPKDIVIFIILWLILPIAFIWILSQQFPLFVDRYFIFCLPPAMIIAALGIQSIKPKISIILTAILVFCMLLAVININIPTGTFQKEDWKEAAEYIKQIVQKEDLVLFRVYQEVIPFQYYGGIDYPWMALETNRQITLPEKEKSYRQIYIIYWVASSSAHTFGAMESHEEEESSAVINQWISEKLIITNKITRYRGLLILVGKLRSSG